MPTLFQTVSGRLTRNQRTERRALATALIALPGSAIVGSVAPGVPVLTGAAAVARFAAMGLVLLYVRRLPRLVLAGSAGGAAAGLLAFGAGSRLAMRIVSLLGGRREVTVEGTMFLLVAGLVFGAIVGVGVSAALRAWPGAKRIVGIVAGIVLASVLLLDSEAFGELVREGPGGWLNFPMFLALPFVYGLLAVRWIGNVERRIPLRDVAGQETATSGAWR